MLVTQINPTKSYDEVSIESCTRPSASIVVPGFNEQAIVEKNLKIICEYMQTLEHRYRWELIFVNDGSTDETGELADRFAATCENMLVLHHPKNFRMGQALRYAFHQCRGDYIVVLDLDLSYSPDHIERLLDKIIRTKAKIVIASPYRDGGKVSNVPLMRRILSKWANRYLCATATRDFFSDKITTITGMVRAYDRKFLNRLNLRAMDVDINPEIIYKAKILRARIVEIPAHLDWSTEKATKKSAASRKSSIRVVRAIIQSFLSGFMFRPFMFFVIPGMVLSLLSLYPLGWAMVHSIRYYGQLAHTTQSFDYRLSDAIGAAFTQSPHAFVVGGFCLIVGIQLFSFGMLALQKKRYFDELFYLGCMNHMRDWEIGKPTRPSDVLE